MPTPRRHVDEVKLQYHCPNKRRINDEHDWVSMRKTVMRGDGANNEIGQIRLQRCAVCGEKLIEGDARALGRKR